VEYPGDDRPRRAIATARRYAVGEAIFQELAAARDAALAAAETAAEAAANAAARASDWAARAAARAAEQEWQTVRLLWYLDGEFDR